MSAACCTPSLRTVKRRQWQDERDANERTEDPSPRRLEEAIKRGDVAKSPEVNTWFMIAGGALMVMVFAAPMATSFETTFGTCSPNPIRYRPTVPRSRSS